jgi:hypothetical protein
LVDLEGAVAAETMGAPAPLLEVPDNDPYFVGRMTTTTRLRLSGVIWNVLQWLYKVQTLDLSDVEMDALSRSSSIVKSLDEAIPLVLVTVQTLAGVPQLGRILDGWAGKDQEQTGTEPAEGLGKDPSYTPWLGFNYWTYDCWVVAQEVISSFLTRGSDMPEALFLESLREEKEIAGLHRWKVPIIVATLYSIKKAPWLWPLLL